MRFAVALILLSMCVPVLGDDPAPVPPVGVIRVISVPAGVTGDGKRESPYLFDASTICVLMFPEPSLEKFDWDLLDAPPDAVKIPGNGAVAFSLKKSGEFLIECDWTGGKSKAWILINGSGPAPPDDTTAALAKRLKAALTGVDASKDAVKWSAICKGFADYLEATPAEFKYGPMKAAWEAALSGALWPAKKYPDLAGIVRDVIPTAVESTPVSAQSKSDIVSQLRVLQITADKIASAK